MHTKKFHMNAQVCSRGFRSPDILFSRVCKCVFENFPLKQNPSAPPIPAQFGGQKNLKIFYHVFKEGAFFSVLPAGSRRKVHVAIRRSGDSNPDFFRLRQLKFEIRDI